MTRPGRAATRRLRLVHPADQALSDLLAALDQWATAADGEPAAYLEIGNDEIRADYTLTERQLATLTTLLRTARSERSTS
jgi:hypothetical protein